MTDPREILASFTFGRVDAETDSKFGHCFIGTEMLRQVLQPQHSLLLGAKGAGKSAIFRLLCDDIQRLKPLLPKEYEGIYSIPVYGLQSEEYIGGGELSELSPTSVDDFRYFWLLYLGLKAASRLADDEQIKQLIAHKSSERAELAYAVVQKVVNEIGLMPEDAIPANLKHRFGAWMKSLPQGENAPEEMGKLLAVSFQQKTGMSIIALLDNIDILLRETNCLAWMMLDKLDLLFIGDMHRLQTAITALVQLLVEYSNRFKNIHFKVFLRTDIFHHLRIVNKSHLVSYTSEMKWRSSLLLKLLVSRAIADPNVRQYCEEVSGEKIDVTDMIIGGDENVLKIFYMIFEPSMTKPKAGEDQSQNVHTWILKRLIDGTGNCFPREVIHLGNLAVEKQREMNRMDGKHASTHLISAKALKEAYEAVSLYRCDTYLYSEFPHLAKHFDVFRGSDSSTFHRQELYMLFEPLSPKGDEAIRAVYYAGLLIPLGKNVDSSRRFKVPLIYKSGLGISDSRAPKRPGPRQHQQHQMQHGEGATSPQ